MNICWHQTLAAIGPKQLAKHTQCCSIIAQSARGILCSRGCQRVGIRRPETTLKYVSNIWDRAFCRPSMEWRQTIFRIRWSDDPKTHQKEWIDTKRVKNLFNNMWGFKTFTHCLQTMIIVMTGLLWLGNGYSASLLKPSQFYVWLFSHHSLWQDVSNTHHCGKM